MINTINFLHQEGLSNLDLDCLSIIFKTWYLGHVSIIVDQNVTKVCDLGRHTCGPSRHSDVFMHTMHANIDDAFIVKKYALEDKFSSMPYRMILFKHTTQDDISNILVWKIGWSRNPTEPSNWIHNTLTMLIQHIE